MDKKEHRPAGGTAWWCHDVMNPVAVYVQGMGYSSTGAQYSVSLVGNTRFCYTAQEADLFDTEKEAQEEYIRRLDKEKEQLRERLQRLERHRSIAIDRIRELENCKQVRGWSTVTTSAVISGGDTSRSNITVVGDGVLEIKDGATVTQLTIKDGGSCKVENAQIEDVHVYNSATLKLSGSSTLYSAKVDSKAELWVAGSAVASTITIGSGGSAFVRYDGTMKLAKIEAEGCLSVRGTSAGVIRVTVSSGGKLYVSQGAYIANCIVESAGALIKYTPYTIENLNIKSGGLDT